LIRATFAAVPSRPRVLAAKAGVLAAITLVAGEVLAFGAFWAGQAALQNPAPHTSLGQPGVLRAVLMAGAYPALVALIGLALGATAQHAVDKFLPMMMAENSMTAVKPVAHSLSAPVSFGLLCGYAAVALAAGAWALARREA